MIELGFCYLQLSIRGHCFGCGWWRGYKLLDSQTWFMREQVTYEGEWSILRVGPFFHSKGPY